MIVPVFNGERTLPATLDSLERLEHVSYEVVFVDDGSSDRTAELVAERGFTLVRLATNLGAGSARNVGAHVAQGEILAFTDADCTVPPHWLDDIEELLDRDDILAVSGPYNGAHSADFPSLFALYLLETKERRDVAKVRSCTTSNLGCRRDLFLKTGGFPIFGLGSAPRRPFQGHEESNWGFLSAEATGLEVLWVPDLGVVHQFRPTVLEFLREQFFYGKVIAVSWCKYPAMLLNSRSNFNKVSTLAHSALLAAAPFFVIGVVLALSLEPILLLTSLALLPAGLLATLALLNLRFLRALAAKGLGCGFCLKSLGLLGLTYGAWITGGLTGLLLAAGSRLRFADLPALPPYEIERGRR